jgi:hypothetical protein
MIIKAMFSSKDRVEKRHAAEAGDKRCRRVEARDPVIHADVQVIRLQDILMRRLIPAIRLRAHFLNSKLAGLPGANIAFVM